MSAQGRTVLVAEDDRDQREILTEVLEAEGYSVITAASPVQLIERLRHKPDLLLLDVHGAFAPDVEHVLRQMGSERPAVLVVSGDVRATEFAALLEADGFVLKPYDLGMLLEEVKRAAFRKPRLRVMDGGLQLTA